MWKQNIWHVVWLQTLDFVGVHHVFLNLHSLWFRRCYFSALNCFCWLSCLFNAILCCCALFHPFPNHDQQRHRMDFAMSTKNRNEPQPVNLSVPAPADWATWAKTPGAKWVSENSVLLNSSNSEHVSWATLANSGVLCIQSSIRYLNHHQGRCGNVFLFSVCICAQIKTATFSNAAWLRRNDDSSALILIMTALFVLETFNIANMHSLVLIDSKTKYQTEHVLNI